MAIISIMISPSAEQVQPGIPATITLSTNVPATIFYTLDGSVPNTYSPVYVAPIIMPEGPLSVTLSVNATDGVDNSATVVQVYTTNPDQLPTASGARLPHSATSNLGNAANFNSLFPFGENGPNPNFQYLNPGDSGYTVNNEALPSTPSGFDGQGNPAGFTNQPLSYYEFQEVYSTLNWLNEEWPGVGNLPATTDTIASNYPVQYRPELSSTADKIFNPKALVIYQDSTTEDPTNPVIINRPYMSLENPETVRDGNLLYNSTLDSPPTMGGFVNRYYNARTNMITYYYYDNTVGRWIISTTPYSPTQNVGALYNVVFGRNSEQGGGSKYFKWYPFLYRTRF